MKDAAERVEEAQNPETDVTRTKEFPSLILKGFIMGSADVVPGVSGGTMALILGIYTRLINTIKSVNLKAIRALLTFRIRDVFDQVHWKFGLALAVGLIFAVTFFTKVIPLPILMHTHPELIYGLFFGLILGSVFLLFRELDGVTWQAAGWTLLGTLIGYKIVTLVPTDTPDNMLIMFLSGSLAISAMVLPGISGSFILLILGKYDTVLGAIRNLGTPETIAAIFVLVPFAIGMIFGIAVFSRLLSWLLRKYHLPTICILIGFMAGSLYIIWPFQEREYVESVRPHTVELQSEEAQEVLDSVPDTRLPEYVRSGGIKNPEASPEEQKLIVEHVKRKVISSHPFIPDSGGTHAALSDGKNSVVHGYGMAGAGLLLVLLIGFLSARKSQDS